MHISLCFRINRLDEMTRRQVSSAGAAGSTTSYDGHVKHKRPMFTPRNHNQKGHGAGGRSSVGQSVDTQPLSLLDNSIMHMHMRMRILRLPWDATRM